MEYQFKNLSEIGQLLIKIGETLKTHEEKKLSKDDTFKEESGILKRKREFSKEKEVVEFQEAKAFFEAHREKLFMQYEGKYIAILNGNVIDVDENFSRLAERTYGKYGYKDIYMPKVESQKLILNIPAPKLR